MLHCFVFFLVSGTEIRRGNALQGSTFLNGSYIHVVDASRIRLDCRTEVT